MRFAVTTILMMHCVTSGLSLAVDTTSTIEGKPMPDKWIKYDLEVPFNTAVTDVSLAPRTDVTVCQAIQTVSACLNIANILISWAKSTGALIKSLSDSGSCATSSGSLNGISFVYYTSGRNCDTTAQEDTIQGAIKQHLENVDQGSLCGTQCLNLSHGGTWEGYLLIGPADSFNSGAYCGSSLAWSQCTSGGKNNL
ncbi:predicted protein [Sclerotinia sclerotiorum 1980 UF-70]|uniref:Secreted protein CSS2 C-terminal domain-containing protein n=2 Tax=Sclerotinia sclerotiorum (strain ATCC 18683 / 1980 / Ss-1) TaxID=665079 RepID=A7EYN6_SCLS1|nr:predicted protein [Sclerotinia sclerotiorum 1980 UF-70]APA16250.1 hypothetical protein sscle_16g110200 [Sclerotinia sclerotiorum 1980 UF-70]EDN94578.1 predicted protein [Sclerotinia sclerotiorum 1980 UF-70]